MHKIINPLSCISIFASHHSDPRASFSTFDFRLLAFGLLLIFSLLTIQSCGLDVEDPIPPSPPIWVQKSLPEDWPEHGIDAHESEGIFLEWEPNPEQGITAYLVYRAELFEEIDSLGAYAVLTRLETEHNSDLSYLDSDITLRTNYYYKLKAVNNSENKGGFSDSLGFLVLPQVPLESMTPNGLLDTLFRNMKLNWRFPSTVEMQDYCLTILDQNNGLVHREFFSPGDYVSDSESRGIPQSVKLESGHVYKWRIDIGANYLNGFETAGSESPWATFLFWGE